MRQFRSASGRTWSADLVRVENLDSRSDTGPDVLRFWSPGLTCDLADWPKDWEEFPEPQLIQLLDRALTNWVASSRT